MSTQERIEKMMKKSEVILQAGRKEKRIKKHTCSECFWYSPAEKECIEGGVYHQIQNLEPNTPACKLFDE